MTSGMRNPVRSPCEGAAIYYAGTNGEVTNIRFRKMCNKQMFIAKILPNYLITAEFDNKIVT